MQITYNYLLNIKYSHNKIIYIMLIFIGIIIYITLSFSTYDKYETFGIYNDGKLSVNIPYKTDNVKNAKYFKYKNKKASFEILDISDLLNDGVVNYQVYELKIDNKYLENEIIQITFYSNKEIIIKKFIKKILGR